MVTNPIPKLKKRLEQLPKLQVFIDGSDGCQRRKLSYSSSTSTRDIDACEIVSSNQSEFG